MLGAYAALVGFSGDLERFQGRCGLRHQCPSLSHLTTEPLEHPPHPQQDRDQGAEDDQDKRKIDR